MKEAIKYNEEEPETKSTIYYKVVGTYSNFRSVMLKKEFSIPDLIFSKCGIIGELNIIWYAKKNDLMFYNYNTNVSEKICTFGSGVEHVISFVPISGIFEGRIELCLLVVTESSAHIYCVDNGVIVGTDFRCSLPSPVKCLSVNNGRIFAGCKNGRAYQIRYSIIDIVGYRYMNFVSPFSILRSVCALFGKRKRSVVDVSTSRNYFVVLCLHEVIVYNIREDMTEEKVINVGSGYVKIQIVEDSPFLFFCMQANGRRDFFDGDKRFFREFPISDFVPESVICADGDVKTEVLVFSDENRIVYAPSIRGIASLVVVSFNEDQRRNFSSIKPAENYDILHLNKNKYAGIKNNFEDSALSWMDGAAARSNTINSTVKDDRDIIIKNSDSINYAGSINYTAEDINNINYPIKEQNNGNGILAVYMRDDSLVVFSEQRIRVYELLDARRFLRICRPDEVWTIARIYGDIEFLVCYYKMVSANEDTMRLEGVCKNETIKTQALFIYIHKLVRFIFKVELSSLFENKAEGISLQAVEATISRLGRLKARISGQKEAVAFIDEFIQTYHYALLLFNYGIAITETFESILLYDNDFKTRSANLLMARLTLTQSIDPLVKIMKTTCPMYLISDQVNFQRGMEMLEKGRGAYLENSLECFIAAKFDSNIIRRYNSIGYFYGSVVLIRDKFDFSYEDAVSLLRRSVKCARAVEAGLVSANEGFLYPFFEVLLEVDNYTECVCCESTGLYPELLRIEHPLFLVFLKDKASSDEKCCRLYWKYLVYHDRKIEAVEAIIGICNQSNLDFSEKVFLLETALTIALGAENSRSGANPIIKPLYNESISSNDILQPNNPRFSEQKTATFNNSVLLDKQISRHFLKDKLLGKIRLMIKLAKIQAELMERDSSLKTNQLLSADTLFNDYCVDYPDLGIKVLDIIAYPNREILRKLYRLYFENKNLSQALGFLRDINNKDISLVFDILVEKSENCIDFCEKLHDAGFLEDDILAATAEYLKLGDHPRILDNLLKSSEKFIERGKLNVAKKFCKSY